MEQQADDSTPQSPEEAHEQQQSPGRVPQRSRFSARIESFHDISSLQFYDEGDISPPQSPTHGRESMVSPPTLFANSSSSSSPEVDRSSSGRWPRPFSSASDGGVYRQLGVGEARTSSGPSRKASKRTAHGGRYAGLGGTTAVDTIAEGEGNLEEGLLPAAAPIDGADKPGPDSPKSVHNVPPPTAAASSASLHEIDDRTKAWQEQEQAGQLTGGLGAGFKSPKIQIREADLPSSSSSPIMQRMPSRAMSFSRRKLPLSRSETRKALGQSEANRTGQAVQVIIEEPAETTDQPKPSHSVSNRGSRIDLSFVAGDAMPGETEELRDLSKRGTAIPIKITRRVETFYPNPDWKPFSMRWPYLLMLIVLSVALAGSTEALYQRSARSKDGGLVTFQKPADIDGLEYFSIKFLPTLIAVVYGVLWQTTDFEVKRLEAYYQLSREGGATAAETLNVDYITSFSFLQPLHAFRRRHYAVAIASIASILSVSAVPTLVSASINLSPDSTVRMADPEIEKHISIDPVWSRLNEAVLMTIALLGCVLFYQLNTRRSGLLADVKGIAGLAAMANVSHILMDFKACDVATHEDIHRKLKNHRYILRNSSLAPMDDSDYDKNNADLNSALAKITGQPEDESRSSAAKYQLSLNPHPLMFRPQGSIAYISGIALFTILLPIFLFTPAGDWTDKAPWVVTALAVCIKLGWGALDTTIRLMEPFYILYRRHAPPRTLTLDYTAMPFAWVAIKALFSRHWLVAAVGFGTVMTEMLTVLVSSLATVEGRAFGPPPASSPSSAPKEGGGIDAGEETVHSFWLSLVSAICILLYMGVVAALVFVHRRHPFLPRQPNTIASVLAFIHQSKMLYDFVGTEQYSNAAMLQHLTDINKSYGLGWFEGRDGRTHCGVDEEELSATYRHGVDFSRSNNPWMESFEEWV